MVKWLISSLVIHALLLLVIFGEKKPKKEENNKKEEHKLQANIGSNHEKAKFFALSNSSDICSNIYIGIGISIDQFTSIITEVSPNGPAYLAGIRVGDAYVDMCEEKEEGLPCVVRTLDGLTREPKTYSIKLKKICAER